MSRSGTSEQVDRAVDRAVRKIVAWGIDGPRPIEEIEAILEHGEAAGPALRRAVGRAEARDLAASIHLVALLKVSEALTAVETATFDSPVPLEAKAEAIEAFRACDREPPADARQRLEAAHRFLQHPDENAVDELVSWPPAWAIPVLESWLDDAGPQSLPLVERGLGQDAAFDRRLLDWLAEQETEEAGRIVQAYLDSTGDRELVKHAKRALHRLRSRGVEIAEKTKSDDTGFSMAVEAGSFAEPRAFITGVDGQGARLVWLLWPSGSGGNRLLQAVVDDAEGFRDAELIAVSRKEFRGYLDRLRANPALLVERIPPNVAVRHLARAASRTEDRGGSPPSAFHEWQAMAGDRALAALDDTDSEPLVYDNLSEDEVRDRSDLIDESLTLLREPYLASWAIVGNLAGRAAEEIRNAESSNLMIDDMQRKERVQNALRKAVEEAFDDATRARYRRRLETMAGMLWEKGDRDAARRALAAAVGFTEVTDLFAGHAFARALVHRGIWLAYNEQRRKEESEQQTSRIIRPR